MILNDNRSRELRSTPLDPLYAVRRRYDEIIAIVSPPRCSSTAVARIFWESAAIRYYAHEPFEICYYRQRPLHEVRDKLMRPIDLNPIKVVPAGQAVDGLLIKEMPYQVGGHFALLADMATRPLIFLMRDPRLSIRSRMKRKIEGGESPYFPLIESGWMLIAEQIDWCRRNGRPYIVVDASELRNSTAAVAEMFAGLDLPFSESMLHWKACPQLKIDNLDGRHDHLYRRVLGSSGLQPARRKAPAIETFPEAHGFRDHVRDCLDIYHDLIEDR